jgi:hypothetical protein
MNKEQLDKINNGVMNIERIERLLSGKSKVFLIRGDNSTNLTDPFITVALDIIRPFLVSLRDVLKAELKDLGYED